MNFQGPLKILENELESIRTRGRESESKLGNKLQAYNNSLNQFEAINRELDKFSRLGIERSVQECQEGISEIESRLKINTEEIANIQKTLGDLDKETSKARAFERNIGDNLRLRSYRSEIEKLEEELNRLDIEGATKASKKYDEEYHKARKYQADLQSEQARLGGEIGIDKKNLKDKRGEMDVEFKDIHRRHRNQLVKVKTIEIANQDLDNLWQKTYQGTDIDKILIKSENENVKSNRSYNYRVVMMKDQVEMDMRGRCSAGQKVLTSIIIRLALAESFGTNCGIMTLDEPTTNLDRDNINALATSLAEIIKERRGQSNFQLVVITHDEDFLNLLGQSDVLDKYWRVSRNLEQKSIIERQRLV
ncbi:hypothetical protein PPACK8108_LOCUS49 [Phakopsora pachyrhizi]|uniref:DNA repair protein RAD50 n=1 Tax=Phakopsora pachyrhizi TaxID=170000 RepID=A0AAV0AFJ9_PHAPC|nr:hypothetical protein PPACK8108_LOCUS49 [Phakopsora pachyrhizi]